MGAFESTERSILLTVDWFDDGYVRALPCWSKKDATTGLYRHDEVPKDPIVKIFRMLGLFCYPRPAENVSSDMSLK
jgi:hypothetical protein